MTSQQAHAAYIGAKGGVGTTVAAVMTAQQLSVGSTPTVLVDLTGDIGVLLGTAPDLPGIADLLSDPTGTVTVADLPVVVTEDVSLLPHGTEPIPEATAERWTHLWSELSRRDAHVVIDAGTAPVALPRLTHSTAQRVMVMTCCY